MRTKAPEIATTPRIARGTDRFGSRHSSLIEAEAYFGF
jgi:hypothetical protein